MTSYSSALDDLFASVKSAESWTADKIILNVAKNLSDDTPVAINLSETIGHNNNVPSGKKRKRVRVTGFSAT